MRRAMLYRALAASVNRFGWPICFQVVTWRRGTRIGGLRTKLIASAIAAVALSVAVGGGPAVPSPAGRSPSFPSGEPSPPPWDPLPEAEEGQAIWSEGSGSQVDVVQFLNQVLQDADQMWTEYLGRTPGFTEPYVTYHLVGTSEEPTYTFSAECGGNTIDGNEPNAYYCPTGQGDIVLPIGTFAKIWNGEFFRLRTQETGDFAAAVVVAHEFGPPCTGRDFQARAEYTSSGQKSRADCRLLRRHVGIRCLLQGIYRAWGL